MLQPALLSMALTSKKEKNLSVTFSLVLCDSFPPPPLPFSHLLLQAVSLGCIFRDLDVNVALGGSMCWVWRIPMGHQTSFPELSSGGIG